MMLKPRLAREGMAHVYERRATTDPVLAQMEAGIAVDQTILKRLSADFSCYRGTKLVHELAGEV